MFNLKLSVLLLVTLFSVSICAEQDVLSYNVELKLQDTWEKLGTLELDQQIQYKKADVKLLNYRNYIIQWDQLEQEKDFGLLKFTNENNSKDYFLSHIDFKQKNKFQNLNKTKKRDPIVPQEVLEIITNIDDQVVAINYAVKKVYQSESDNIVMASFIESQEATEAYFIAGTKGQAAPGSNQGANGNISANGQGQEPQAEQAPTGILGFLKNNFWYVLIFLLVVMLISNGEEAAQGAQGAAGGQATAAASGGRKGRR